MSMSLYPRLVISGMRRSRQTYLPYLLTVAGTAAAFYVIAAIATDPGTANMPGARFLPMIMGFGMVVAGLFSAVFLLYTNSFLIKGRLEELGLYSVLGMSRGHIALLLVWESLALTLAGVGGGLLLGIPAHMLASKAVSALIRMPISLELGLRTLPIAITAALFGGVMALSLIWNLIYTGRKGAVSIMRESRAGEKAPPARPLMAILGLLCLGCGYRTAMTTESSVQAIQVYFPAVLMVMAGTYLLFTAVSVTLVGRLRKTKSVYYTPGGFIGLSLMHYRIKRSGVSLASICILSTMVLVMLSGTVSLYAGTDRLINEQCPADLCLTVYGDPLSPDELARLGELAEGSGCAVIDIRAASLEDTGPARSRAELELGGTVEEKELACKLVLQGAEKALSATRDEVRFFGLLRSSVAEEMYSMTGSFLFLGVVLGAVFVMGAVMMIYYKQVSEGLDDRRSFEVMARVGLSRRELKRTVRTQVLAVFFAPLIMAGVHVIFDFAIMTRLLELFELRDSGLTAACTLGVFLVFAAAYGLTYALTARAYYRIVAE